MYGRTKQLSGLGVTPAAVIGASSIIKGAGSVIGSMFGGKLVYGLKESEFQQRFTDPHWFRALWDGGYWTSDGVAELGGITPQDYFVLKLGQYPYLPAKSGNLARLISRGVPLTSLRLSKVPTDLLQRKFEGQTVGALTADNVYTLTKYVLPPGYTFNESTQKIVAPTAASTTGTVAASIASTSSLLPLLLIAGGLVFVTMRR